MMILALALGGGVVAPIAAAQIACELCTEMQPGWDGYVVTSQMSSADCGPMKPGAARAGASSAWQRDARRVAAVAFGRLPRERADDPAVGALLRQMTVVLETDTDAIVLGQVGQIEQRACMMRSGTDDAWMVIRLDVADLSRPAPATGPGVKP